MSKVTYTKKRRRPGCLIMVLILIAAIGALIWFSGSLTQTPGFASSFIPTSANQYGVDEAPPFNEVWSEGHGSNKVVRIPITGMITLNEPDGFFPAPGSAAMAYQAIKRATWDKQVKAIILDIDSGGGGITASDRIYQALVAFKESSPDRKIVAICGDLAASGAYYIALAADHIIARPTTLTGSIGVIIQTLNFKEFANRHGVTDVTVKSGDNKDLLNPLGDISSEEVEIVQQVIDSMHDRFKDLIADNRELSRDDVSAFADGRIFTAQQAQALDLIDAIGYWPDALAATRTLLDEEQIIVFRYESGFSLRNLIRAFQSFSPQSLLNTLQSPRLQYRWQLAP